jgi:hypothetical protein
MSRFNAVTYCYIFRENIFTSRLAIHIDFFGNWVQISIPFRPALNSVGYLCYTSTNNFLKPTIDSLIRLIRKLLDNPKLSDLRTILMVGSFAECELVQDAIRDKIGSSIKLIIPEEAGLAVLKGAVLFGHQPKIVCRRIAKITYGIQSWFKQITESFRRNMKLFLPILDTPFVTACRNRIFKCFVMFFH